MKLKLSKWHIKYLLQEYDWPRSNMRKLFYWNGFEWVLYTVPRMKILEKFG